MPPKGNDAKFEKKVNAYLAKINKLAEEKKYWVLTKYMIELQAKGQEKKSEYAKANNLDVVDDAFDLPTNPESEAISRYVANLTAVENEGKKNEEIIGIGKNLYDLQAHYSTSSYPVYENMKNRIKKGEVKGTEYIANEDKTLDKVAGKLVSKTSYSSEKDAIEGLTSSILDLGLMGYKDEKLITDIKKKSTESAEAIYKDYVKEDKEKEKILKEKLKDGEIKEKGIYNDLKMNIYYSDDLIPFSEEPKVITDNKDSSSAEVGDYIESLKTKLDQVKKYEEQNDKTSPEAKKLYGELKEIGLKSSKSIQEAIGRLDLLKRNKQMHEAAPTEMSRIYDKSEQIQDCIGKIGAVEHFKNSINGLNGDLANSLQFFDKDMESRGKLNDKKHKDYCNLVDSIRKVSSLKDNMNKYTPKQIADMYIGLSNNAKKYVETHAGVTNIGSGWRKNGTDRIKHAKDLYDTLDIALTSFMKDYGAIVKDERKFDVTLQDAPLYFQNKQSKLRNDIDSLKQKAELKVSNGVVAQDQKSIQDGIINLDKTIEYAQKKLLNLSSKPELDEKEIKKKLAVIAIGHFFKMPNIAKRYTDGVPKEAFKAEYKRMIKGQTLNTAINDEGLQLLIDNAVEGKGEEFWMQIKAAAKKVVNEQPTNSKENVRNKKAGTKKAGTKKTETVINRTNTLK